MPISCQARLANQLPFKIVPLNLLEAMQVGTELHKFASRYKYFLSDYDILGARTISKNCVVRTYTKVIGR